MSGRKVNFLDMELTLSNGQVDIDMYRKPQARYLYAPWASCHPRGSLSGIASSEAHRAHRLAKCTHVQRHLDFLKRNLVNRGFPSAVVLRVFARVGARASTGGKKTRKTRTSRCHVFRVLHSAGTRSRELRKALARYKHVLAGFGEIKLSMRLQRNQFMAMYSTSWPSKAALG